MWGDSAFGFDLRLPDDEWCWAFLHVPSGHLISSLEKCLFQSSAHFLIKLFDFLLLSCMCMCVLYIFWLLAPYRIHDLQSCFFHPVCCHFSRGSSFILLHVAVQFSQHCSIKENILSPLYILGSSVVNQLIIYPWIYFWAFYLFYWSMPNYFGYDSNGLLWWLCGKESAS